MSERFTGGEPAIVLEVLHETHYDYAMPVSQAHHLAYLKPLHDARQRLHEHVLHIDPGGALRTADVDVYGNARLFFALAMPHRQLRVHALSRVARLPGAALRAEHSPPWEAVRDRLLYAAGSAFDPAVEFAQPSPYVPRLQALRAYGAESFAAGTPLAAGVLQLMHRLHRDFAYQPASTAVDTPLAEVFEHRRGVCQDFAHLMIGALRMQGLAARYVSGYLLTTPPPGDAPLLGADASHAWVQVYCPDTPGLPEGWLELDPTNDRLAGTGHVRLALGRDYGDVAPLRGVIRGGGAHTLAVRVRVRRIEPHDAGQ